MDAEIKFAYIPPGNQSIGSTLVTVKGFYMGVYPVTQAQFRAVMGYNPAHFTGDETRPVENVNWFDARDFCKALAGLTGKPIRLPTEAEWELACCARGSEFHGGNGEMALDEVGWYLGNSEAKTQPVGKLKKNAFNLHDMHGNVWEWCADIHRDPYSDQGLKDWHGNDQANNRVLRGVVVQRSRSLPSGFSRC